jgi:hypothetical protein
LSGGEEKGDNQRKEMPIRINCFHYQMCFGGCASHSSCHDPQ